MASDSVNIIAAMGGEVVTYLPHNGTAKTFKALIERNRSHRVESVDGSQYGVRVFEVWIPVDAVDGLLAVDDKGLDRIRFKKRRTDAEETEFTVRTILSQDVGLVATDAGMWHLEVRA